MGQRLTPNKEYFLDTSYAVALLSQKDQYHAIALEVAASFAETPVPLITTQAVVFEVCSSLAKPPYRKAALEFLDGLQMDTAIEVVAIDPLLFAAGVDLYKQREDKAWSLTDCISFIVMSQRGMTEALTADDHFEQAGFRALLKN